MRIVFITVNSNNSYKTSNRRNDILWSWIPGWFMGQGTSNTSQTISHVSIPSSTSQARRRAARSRFGFDPCGTSAQEACYYVVPLK